MTSAEARIKMQQKHAEHKEALRAIDIAETNARTAYTAWRQASNKYNAILAAERKQNKT